MRFLISLLVLSVFITVGCSGGGKNPISPSETHEPGVLADIPLIGLSESGESSNAIGILGAYELSVNGEELKADLVAKRTATIGESYLVNGARFFTYAPCKDCLRISGMGITANGMLELEFTLKHPFQVGNPQKPPSGLNRKDLDIFDPILIFHPKNVTPKNFSLMKTKIYDQYTVASAGYTKEIANLIQDDAACPYYLVVDDSQTGARNYNRFPQGATKSFSTYLRPAASLIFDLYLTFGYGASATFMDRLCPHYFNPEFNRKNAWKVQATPPQGNLPPKLGNTWQENDPTTKYSVTVKVWDWQHGITTIKNPPVDPADIAFPSSVLSVSVEIPGMTDSIPSTNVPSGGSGTDPRFPLIFHVPIANENLLPPGQYLSLVKVTDERVPPSGASFGQIDTMINAPNTGAFQCYDIPEFATYTTFIATVVDEPCLASGEITSPSGDDYTAYSTEVVNFQINGVPFGHNQLVAYWADWGTGTFTESNTVGEFSHQFIDTDCPVFADDIYNVRFGLELDCTEGGIIPIDSIKIKMTCPPCNATGSVVSPTQTTLNIMNGQTIEFELTAEPNGGNIIAYWADWGTGQYTESSPTPIMSHQFTSDACPDFNQPPPDVGNVTMRINRVYTSYGVAFAPNNPYTLSWEDPGGTPNDVLTVRFGVELDCYPGNINHIGTRTVKITSCYDYEIYWDNNPTDGLMNNLEFLAETQSKTWNAPPDHLNVNGTRYAEGNTYVVYSRNCLGVKSTNPSEPAHIIICGAETLGNTLPYNAEGWLVNNRSGQQSSHICAPYSAPQYPAHGSWSIRFGDKVGQSIVGTWEGISRPTPTVPNSTVRYIEFSMFKYDPG